ncbi:MAG: hypothetical protein LBJ64_06095 [Deltaproteobacteria bacterium]|nr:hypothetical protein [Deltaproteobacteria bacterium]
MLQLVVTMKNMALYPDTNKTNIESVSSLHLWLSEFLSHTSPLVLEVKQTELLTEDGIVVYQERPNDQLLSAPLFRDGIQHISFEQGLTEKELRLFLSILLRFRNQDSEDDDLVASLWEASLSNIKYIIASEYEQVEPEFDISALKVAVAGIQQFRDADAPWNDNPLAPMSTEGIAPVSKPISTLFALAESAEFFSSTGDGIGDGGVAPGAEEQISGFGGGGGQIGEGKVAEGGGDYGGATVDDSSGGFDFSSSGDDSSYSNSFDSSDDDLPTGFGPFAGDGPPNLAQPSSEGINAGERPGSSGPRSDAVFGGDAFRAKAAKNRDSGQMDDQAESDDGCEKVDGIGGEAADASQDGQNGKHEDDAELDIDMDSVADAFRDMEQRAPEEKVDRPPVNPLTLEMLKDRPASDGPELTERLKYWGLTGREIKQISALLKWDEGRNFSYDTMEIIKNLLSSPILTQKETPLLISFLTNELKNSLKKVDLQYFNSFYQHVKDRSSEGQELETMVLNELQRRFDSTDILLMLIDPGPTEETISANYEDLRYFLYQLSSVGIQTLASFLPKIAKHKLWSLIIELVAYDLLHNSQRSLDTVKKLNDRSMVSLIRLVQPNLKLLPAQLINYLTRHKSPAVREAIARAILEHDPAGFQNSCAHMVLDPDPAVQNLVRSAVSSKRNSAVEGHLFNYLRNSYSNDRHDDDRQLLDCYRLYGLCASPSALPFLEEVLLKKDFKTFLSRQVDQHKLGAALALLLMPQEQGASDILAKASRSSFRNVRQAYLEAKQIASSLNSN